MDYQIRLVRGKFNAGRYRYLHEWVMQNSKLLHHSKNGGNPGASVMHYPMHNGRMIYG